MPWLNDLLRRILFLPEQASTFAVRIDQLHYFVIGTTFVVSFLSGTTAIAFFWRYRRRGKAQVTPRLQAGWKMEAAFIGVPLAFFLLWFFLGFRDYVWLSTPPPDAMDVYVTAKQWMWEYTYPRGPSAIEVLHVPAHRPVRLLITSRDVIHSFFVPSFRIKQDALPGRYTQIWFEATLPGTYDVFCAEFCGLDHSRMRGSVVVMEPDDYDRWLAEQEKGLVSRQDAGTDPSRHRDSDLAAVGRTLAITDGCLKCHTVDGSPHIGPTWLGLYGREESLDDGTAVRADEAYLTESMMDPQVKVVKGFKPVMPSYLGKLEGPDTAAIVEYIKSLRTGPAVTGGAP